MDREKGIIFRPPRISGIRRNMDLDKVFCSPADSSTDGGALVGGALVAGALVVLVVASPGIAEKSAPKKW